MRREAAAAPELNERQVIGLRPERSNDRHVGGFCHCTARNEQETNRLPPTRVGKQQMLARLP